MLWWLGSVCGAHQTGTAGSVARCGTAISAWLGRHYVSTHRVLRPGKNCWKIAASERLAFLVDGKQYFDAVAAAFQRARQRILIVGWDFDSRIRLQPDLQPDLALGDFLRTLVEGAPDLTINILVWRNSVFYGSNPEFPGLPAGEWLAGDWLKHERIQFLLDSHHPVGSSQHQKIVVIDDSVAFVGGIDLTQGRWDTNGHSPDHPHRLEAEEPHAPVHDLMMMVEGEAARAISICAHERWRLAGGGPLEAVGPTDSLWPDHVRPAVRRHRVAIARTLPTYGEQREVREIERLNLDCLAAAQDSIYLEQQYFAIPAVANILMEHLQRHDGPEIAIVCTCRSKGVIEQYIMAQTRDRLFAQLRAADRFNRLRMFYPVSGPEPDGEIEVHSKVVIVDDWFLRIGSSNLNNRSLGVDTECDLALEAETPAALHAIARLRTQLLAEHLDVRADVLEATHRQRRSLIAAIDALNRGPRGLVGYDADDNSQPGPLPRAKQLLDPDRPLDLRYLWLTITETSWTAAEETETQTSVGRSPETPA